MANISLFSPLQGDYSSRSAELARQQKLAQMLEQMSQQEIPISTAGGITAPVSPYGALAKALSSFGGSYLSGKSAADEAELKKSDQEMAQKVAQNLYVMPAGSRQPDVGMIDTKGIEGAGPSFAVTGKTNLEDTATTPQQQLQMLAPLMAGGEASRSVYNAFMPGAIKQQQADVELDRQVRKYTPLINSLSQDQQTKVNALIAANPQAGLDLVSEIFKTDLSAPKIQRIPSQLGGYDEIVTSPNGVTTRQHFDLNGNPTGSPTPDNARKTTASDTIGNLPVIKTKTINNITYYQTSDGKWHE